MTSQAALLLRIGGSGLLGQWRVAGARRVGQTTLRKPNGRERERLSAHPCRQAATGKGVPRGGTFGRPGSSPPLATRPEGLASWPAGAGAAPGLSAGKRPESSLVAGAGAGELPGHKCCAARGMPRRQSGSSPSSRGPSVESFLAVRRRRAPGKAASRWAGCWRTLSYLCPRTAA